MDRNDPYDPNETPSFVERHRVLLGVVALVVVALGVTAVARKFSGGGGAQRKGSEMVSVRLPPPAPTPPPPPSTPPPVPEMKQEQKMIEQSPVDEHEEKPKDEPPPAAPISTGIKGDGGPDGFGVGGGNGNGLIGGGAARQRTKWGWYAGLVQSGIGEVLRQNPELRAASTVLTVRIWADSTGRVSRAKVADASGNPKIVQAVQDALTGFQLKEPPPAGMPLPIVMKITAKRPH